MHNVCTRTPTTRTHTRYGFSPNERRPLYYAFHSMVGALVISLHRQFYYSCCMVWPLHDDNFDVSRKINHTLSLSLALPIAPSLFANASLFIVNQDQFSKLCRSTQSISAQINYKLNMEIFLL